MCIKMESLKYIALLVINNGKFDAPIFQYEDTESVFETAFKNINWIEFPFHKLPEFVIRDIMTSFFNTHEIVYMCGKMNIDIHKYFFDPDQDYDDHIVDIFVEHVMELTDDVDNTDN